MSVEEECLGTGKRFPQFCTGIHQSLIWRRCQIRFGSHCTTEPAEGEKIWGCHYLVIEEKKALFVIIRDKYLGCQWDGYPWTQSSAGPSLRPGERWFRPSSWTRQTEQRSPPPTKVYLVTWHELLSFDVESMLIKEKTRNKTKFRKKNNFVNHEYFGGYDALNWLFCTKVFFPGEHSHMTSDFKICR